MVAILRGAKLPLPPPHACSNQVVTKTRMLRTGMLGESSKTPMHFLILYLIKPLSN